jgi:hypothetical protein
VVDEPSLRHFPFDFLNFLHIRIIFDFLQFFFNVLHLLLRRCVQLCNHTVAALSDAIHKLFIVLFFFAALLFQPLAEHSDGFPLLQHFCNESLIFKFQHITFGSEEGNFLIEVEEFLR